MIEEYGIKDMNDRYEFVIPDTIQAMRKLKMNKLLNTARKLKPTLDMELALSDKV